MTLSMYNVHLWTTKLVSQAGTVPSLRDGNHLKGKLKRSFKRFVNCWLNAGEHREVYWKGKVVATNIKAYEANSKVERNVKILYSVV